MEKLMYTRWKEFSSINCLNTETILEICLMMKFEECTRTYKKKIRLRNRLRDQTEMNIHQEWMATYHPNLKWDRQTDMMKIKTTISLNLKVDKERIVFANVVDQGRSKISQASLMMIHQAMEAVFRAQSLLQSLTIISLDTLILITILISINSKVRFRELLTAAAHMMMVKCRTEAKHQFSHMKQALWH